MKYMGSKRAMLQNGLGTLLIRQVCVRNRFVDLFAGSAAVAIYIAERKDIRVRAVDLQSYSGALARAVLSRREAFCWRPIWRAWLKRAEPNGANITVSSSETHAENRETNSRLLRSIGFANTKSYGGHYFSADQALWLDALRVSVPRTEPARSIALAALIRAASQCAASPGHTAQPFQPTRTAKKFLVESLGARHC